MGTRSDWNSAPASENVSENGDTPANGTEAGEEDGEPSRRRWTIYDDEKDVDARKSRQSADDHVHNYVQDQLKRLMSPDAPPEVEDEIEAKYDGM